MGTECSASQLEFGGLGKRAVVGVFDGGEIATDGGGLALRELEERVGILKRLGECFSDHRDPRRIEHRVETLVKQRVLGICLGYEDLNDHDELCRDRLLALLCDCEDVAGARRQRETDRGKPLAGKSTLNRLELTLAADAAAHRYKKIVADMAAMDALLVETFLEAHETPPARIVLDVDATDDTLHGMQEGRHFPRSLRTATATCRCMSSAASTCCARGCARRRSTARRARLRNSTGSPHRSAHAGRRRASWCAATAAFAARTSWRGDEASGVDYVLGLPVNRRLTGMVAATLYETRLMTELTGETTRRFDALRYAARSWSRARRVVARVEHSALGPNPRFVVTSIATEAMDEQALYEKLYCARGDMENRIKEQQLDPVLRLVRLCADADAASRRTRRNAAGQGAVRHDSRPAAQGRRARARQRAPHQVVLLRVVAARRTVPTDPVQPPGHAIALLTQRSVLRLFAATGISPAVVPVRQPWRPPSQHPNGPWRHPNSPFFAPLHANPPAVNAMSRIPRTFAVRSGVVRASFVALVRNAG